MRFPDGERTFQYDRGGNLMGILQVEELLRQYRIVYITVIIISILVGTGKDHIFHWRNRKLVIDWNGKASN